MNMFAPMRNDQIDHTSNAFDFLRVIAALSVLYSHSYALYGLPEPQPIAGQSFGSLAVAMFFAVSGYLVCQSWSRDPSIGRFFIRRGLRIMPGLVVVSMYTAIIVGPVFTSWTVGEYFSSQSVWKYIVNTCLMQEQLRLPGVFETNPRPFGVNGSLWTLSYEIFMYVSLAFAGFLLPKRMLRIACLLIFAACTTFWVVVTVQGLDDLKLPFFWRFGTIFYADKVSYLGAYFFAGACLYLYREKIVLHPLGAALLILLSVAIPNSVLAMCLLWIAVPYAALTIAYQSPKFLRRMNGLDYSYGIYIYAFPIQQAINQYAIGGTLEWSTTFLLSFVITVLFAGLSWHLIERPALALKTKIIRSVPVRAVQRL
jgi:peptidoglycan/LPS O-acetylase OafA/YrhL